MERAQDIIDRVRERLARAGQAKIAARRQTIVRLAEARASWPGLKWSLRSRAHAVFTIDQGRMLKANRSVALKLLVRGHHVADVELCPDGRSSPEMCVREETLEEAKIPAPGRTLKWSGGGRDGKAIRKLIADCSQRLRGSPELQVQLELVQLLERGKSQVPQLRNVQPVMPFGFPTELATVVGRKQQVATGNLDILARTGRGRGGGQYVVLELKNPEIGSSGVAEAFAQAIGYAAALTFEANGFDPARPHEALPHYRRLFSSDPKRDADYSGRPLVAHAVVVLPTAVAGAAERALASLLEGGPPMALGRPMGVGALLYEASRVKNEWRLGKLRWLEHAGSWRP